MQLIRRRTGERPKRHLSIRDGLTAATCALVGIGAGADAARAGEIDAAVLLYSEFSRVTVLEGVAKGRREIGDDGRAVGFHLTADALTGASANGAIPAKGIQTFTSPSGQSSYSSEAGKTPLNDTFQDQRLAAGGTWEQPFDRLSKGVFGLDLSWERDYQSVGLSSVFSRDFFLRNTTLSAGVSGSWDRVDPTGGAPDGLTSMPPPGSGGGDDKAFFEDDEGGASGPAETKTTAEWMAGVTQIVNRTTLMQVNYSRSHSHGYLTDPYKLLSVVDAAAAPQDYRYEKRPDSRTKQAVFVEAKHHFAADVIDLTYRYLWDDWGVVSHTADMKYRWRRAGPDYWEPHVRYYRQTAADFYTRYLEDGAPLPEFASADYRLGELKAYTAGLKYGRTLEDGREIGIRLEYYWQTNAAPSDGPPDLPAYDLYPTVHAGILQVDYSFDW